LQKYSCLTFSLLCIETERVNNSHMEKYKISVLTSLDHLKKIGPEWNELLRSSQADTVFLTWEWQYSWAEAYLGKDNQLFVLAIFLKDKLIGLAPWYIRKSKEFGLPIKNICFIGTPESASDYLDVIIPRGKEKEITAVIYKYLFSINTNVWDILMLRDIPSDSRFLQHFLEYLEQDGKYVEISYSSFCPITILPKTRDDFLLGLSPNRRQQYKRHLRLLEKEGDIRFHSNSKPDLREIDDFFSFYDKVTNFSSKDVKPVIEKLLSNCCLKEIIKINTLYSGEKKLAALLHLKHQQTLFMYLMAIDKGQFPKISVGNIAVGMCIEDGLQCQCRIYDFLKGAENYKFHWANSSKTSLSLVCYKSGMITLLNYLVRTLKNFGKIILR